MIKRITALAIFLILSFNAATCIGEEKKAETILKDLSFDKKTGVVSYELTLPAWVRIRIGIADGPLYRTLLDWQERGVGKYKEQWDGLDSSAAVKLTGRDDLVFTFNYFTAGNEYLQYIQVADILPLPGNLSGRHLPALEVNRMHKNHPRQFCREPKIEVQLPKNIPKNRDGLYVIKTKVPLEIKLADEDRRWFSAERYNLHIFIDDIFAQGELNGYSPYTWIFDPQGLNAGKHLLVVNLAGLNDHYGIVSLPIYVEKENKPGEKSSKEDGSMLKSNCSECKE
jgi:hypothetical protein